MNWFAKNKITSYFITDKTEVIVINKQGIITYIQFIAEKNKIGYKNTKFLLEVHMTKLNDIYKCKTCGNIVEVVHAAGGELSCCGHAMKLMQAGLSDGAAEKHVPVIEKIDGGYRVTVGSVEHPMMDNHYIEWIELVCEKCGKVQRKYLKPGEKPQAEFKSDSDKVIAREYCNLHGLWQKEN